MENRMVGDLNRFSSVFHFFYKNHKKVIKIQFTPIFFPPEGNFDIGAGDGDGGGGQQITKNHKNIFRTRIAHTSGTFFEKFQNRSLKYVPVYRK